MKKKLVLSLVVLVLLVASLGLVACVDKTAPTAVTVTIYIGEAKYANIAGYSNENLFDHLTTLCSDNKLAISYTGSSYGAFITEVGSLKAGDSSFISIFSSDEKIKDLSEYSTTINLDGKTLFSAGLGASSIKLIDGGVYAFTLISF